MSFPSSKKLVLLGSFFVLSFFSAFSQVTGDCRTIASGAWSTLTNWERFNGSLWVTPVSVPSSADNNITIQSPHSMTIGANVTVDQMTINSGGAVTVSSGFILTTANGTGTDLTVSSGGTLTNNGTLTLNTLSTATSIAGTMINSGTVSSTTATLNFTATGIYQHNFSTAFATVGAIPTATWSTGSLCEILACGSATTGPTGLVGQTFSDFSWNCTTQLSNINLAGTLVAQVGRDFYMKSTGAGSNTLSLKAIAGGSTSIGGSFYGSGGTLIIADGTIASTGNNTMNVGGVYQQTGGTVILTNASGSGGSANGNGYINVTGLVTISGGSLILSTSPSNASATGGTGYFTSNNAGTMNINGTATVNLSASSGDGSGGGGQLQTTGPLTISGSATVNLSTSTRTGGGGNGTMIIGGLMTLSSGTINGSTLNGNGSINANLGFIMSGGTINLTKTTATSGGAGNGTLNIAGGACTISGGTFNLNTSAVAGSAGATGTISASSTLDISGTAIVNFNSSTTTGGGGNSAISVTGLTTISGGTVNGNTSNAATTGCNTDFNANGGLTVSGGTFNVCSATCTTGSSAGGGNTSIDVTGATIFSGTGTINLASGGGTGSGGNIGTINANGTFTMNSGTPSFNLCSSSTTGGGSAGSGALNVTGNFSHTLASTTISKTAATNTGTITLTGSSAQTLESTNGFNIGNTIIFNIDQNASTSSIAVGKFFLVNQGTTFNVYDNTTTTTELTVAGTLNVSGTMNVYSDAILDMGTTTMSNATATGGFFNLSGTSGLITKHAGGIAALGSATGCIQVTGGRSYSSDADYTYNSTAANQVTGTGLPTALTSNSTLTINNLFTSPLTATVGVTLTQATQLDGALVLTRGRFLTTSTNLLTIGAGGTSTPGLQAGGSQTVYAFVDGPIKKIGSTSFVFPTGDLYNLSSGTKIVKWARIEMTAPGGASEAFMAEYHKIDDPCPSTQVITSSNVPAAPFHVSYKEYWDLTRTASATSSTPTITLYWEDGSETSSYGSGVSSATNANLHVAECITGSWNDKGVSLITGGTAYAPGKILAGSAGTFTTGTLMYFTLATPTGVNPLPVELLSFTGYSTASANILNWQTATETNNSHFDVERSADATNFSQIGTIEGNGIANQVNSYELPDNSPFTGMNYYRLKQVDFNGDYKYSGIVSIDRSAENSVGVYPNPTTDAVTIVSSAELESMMIYNPLGELVYSSRNEYTTTFKPLSAGVYIVKTIAPDGKQAMTRFIRR